MIDDKISASIVNRLKKAGATNVILEITESNEVQVKFANSKIAGVTTWQDVSGELFASKETRLVSTTIQDFSGKSLKKQLKKIEYALSTSPSNEEFKGIAKGPFSYAPLSKKPDRKAASPEALVKTVRKILKITKEKGMTNTAGVLQGSSYSSSIISSAGAKAKEKGSTVYLSVRTFRGKESSGHGVGFSRSLKELDIEGIISHAVDIASKDLVVEEGREGKFDVIFSPLAFSCILSHVGDGLSAFSVDSGSSPFDKLLKKKAASPLFTLWDDGRAPDGYNSSSFDDEGRPTKRTLLFDKGVLKTFLHSTSTAKRMKARPTSNAGIIQPRPTNLSLKPGAFSLDQLISKVKNGFYVTNLWYTRFQNYHSGDFSTIPRDGLFVIKDGKIISCAKNLRITENLIRILKNISAIGKDVVPIVGWEAETPCFCPSVLVRNVNFTKPTS